VADGVGHRRRRQDHELYGSMLGVRVLQPNNSVTTRYFQTGNLGSLAVITDESGNVVGGGADGSAQPHHFVQEPD
jgi:hypothetical protein